MLLTKPGQVPLTAARRLEMRKYGWSQTFDSAHIELHPEQCKENAPSSGGNTAIHAS